MALVEDVRAEKPMRAVEPGAVVHATVPSAMEPTAEANAAEPKMANDTVESVAGDGSAAGKSGILARNRFSWKSSFEYVWRLRGVERRL